MSPRKRPRPVEDDLIVVGQSELKDFRQCPLKHKFRWIDGWYVPEGHWGASPKSEIGTQWHAVLAAHWRFKQKAEAAGDEYRVSMAAEVMHDAIGEIVEIYESDDERQQLLVWMAEGYLERWGVDPDWEVLQVEERLVVPLADPDNPDAAPEFALRFTADLVVRSRQLGRKVIVDGKTVESQGLWTSAQLDLDDQVGIYLRGLARLWPDDPPAYGMLDQTRRDKLKRPMHLAERFSRPRSTRTTRELDEIERDALTDLRRMHGVENLTRPSSHPNPRQCSWSCDFQEPHIALRRSGGDWAQAVRIMEARGMSNDPEHDPALRVR